MTDNRKPAEEPFFDPVDGIRLIASWARHRQFVEEGLLLVTSELERRAIVHDASKMLTDEFAGFSRINAHARIHKFGSPEYQRGMCLEAPTVTMHFRRNSHHPEFGSINAQERSNNDGMAYAAGVGTEFDMTFLDVIEMVCDWWGARKGYDDSRGWLESVRVNMAHKGEYLKPWQVELAQSVADYLERTGKA